MVTKKWLFVGIFTLLSLSLALAAPPAVHPVTGAPLVITCPRGTPDAIDGDLSDWNLEAMTPAVLDAAGQMYTGQASWTGPADCSGKFYLMWDDKSIYFGVAVKDDTLSMTKTGVDIWNADCIEVFLSTTNAVAGHAEHYQWGFNANNQKWCWDSMEGTTGDPAYLKVVSRRTADGYVCEASLEYAGIRALKIAAGNTIGFHPVIDDTEATDREIQMTWTGREAHDQSLGFGYLIFSSDPAIAKELSRGPSPAKDAVDVPVDTILSWTPGKFAASHDVYFGTTFADVNTASRTNPKGVLASQGQAATTFDPPGALAYGQTYYWRVDEVNAAPANTIFKGEVWSFTAEPYGHPITGVAATASSAQVNMGPVRTIDGSGLDKSDLHGADGTTMWLSTGAQPNWIQYQFDKVYKLFDLKVWNSNGLIESFIGFGAKKVTIEYSTDGTTWTALANVPEFARAPGMAGYAANTTVSFGGVTAQYVKLTINSTWGGVSGVTGLSEVRFSYVPVQAFAPQPATAATGVAVDASLSWRPGREAKSHKVFLGTDQAAVAGGTVAAKTVTERSYIPSGLNFGTTYYWRVDEVNTVTYPGDVWNFTTQEYAVVDDFESYNDDDKRIYDTWIDGLTDGKSGSIVGYDKAPFAEQTIIHGGKQSMPMSYDNTGKFSFSEAVRTFDSPQNWTANGIKSLSLYFQGAAGNGGQLYLKINNLKVSYNGNAGDLAKLAWTPWNIDLSTVGGSVSNVTKLTIGIEGSGKGIVYLDDIRLYPKTPAYTTPVDPGKTNLVALYALDGNANDSSGKGNNGTVNGTGTWVPGMVNQALQFNGTSTYVDCGSGASLKLTDAVTITAWIKMDFTAGDRKIAGNQDGTTGGYKFGVYSSNMAEFEIRTSANAATLNRASAGGTALQQGVWYHVAGVYSKGQYIRTYVYGNLDRELLTTAVLGSSTGTFKLGREPFSAGSYWLGALDDVEVYNRALSPEEILWLAGQTKPVAKPF